MLKMSHWSPLFFSEESVMPEVTQKVTNPPTTVWDTL